MSDGVVTQLGMFGGSGDGLANYLALQVSLGAVARWRLNDTTGIVAVDDIGSSDGSYLPNSGGNWTGGTLGLDGPLNQTSIEGNGTNGYVDLGTAPHPVEFSFEVWVLVDGLARYPFSSRSTSGSAGYEILIGNAFVPGTARIRIGGVATADVTGLNDGAWHQLVATFGATEIKLYADGGDQIQSASRDGLTTPTQNLSISRRGSTFTDGQTALLCYYDYELTGAQIAALYAAAGYPL